MFVKVPLITFFVSICVPSIAWATEHPNPDRARLCAENARDAGLKKATEQICAQYATERGDPAASAPRPRIADIDRQRIFVRMDPLDNFFYGYGTNNPGPGQAAGASVSFTENELSPGSNGTFSTTQTMTVAGIASYTLFKNPAPIGNNFQWVPAVWVSANGTLDNPLKTTTDFNALKSGLDFQFQHYGGGSFLPFLDEDYYSIAPYYQTDFQGVAHAEGVRLAWEPIFSAAYLGSSNPTNNFIDGFWEIRPETTFLSVTNPGLTNLFRGSYEWTGGIARAYLFPFPSYKSGFWSPYLADRISLIATAEYFWNAYAHNEVRYYSAQISYNLSGCTVKDIKCIQGTAAISFEYDHGVDPDTLFAQSKYLAKLSYKQ